MINYIEKEDTLRETILMVVFRLVSSFSLSHVVSMFIDKRHNNLKCDLEIFILIKKTTLQKLLQKQLNYD